MELEYAYSEQLLFELWYHSSNFAFFCFPVILVVSSFQTLIIIEDGNSKIKLVLAIAKNKQIRKEGSIKERFSIGEKFI